MKPKTLKTIYWVVTVLFALAMFGDAFGGITSQPAGAVILKHLGYPLYNMPLFGVAKLLGAIAILQPKFRAIKEWAYAGFAFNFICAIASRAIVGDPFVEFIPAAVMLVIMFTSYFLWKQVEQLKTA